MVVLGWCGGGLRCGGLMVILVVVWGVVVWCWLGSGLGCSGLGVDGVWWWSGLVVFRDVVVWWWHEVG